MLGNQVKGRNPNPKKGEAVDGNDTIWGDLHRDEPRHMFHSPFH